VTSLDDRPVGRSPGITYQELLDRDTHPVAPSLRWVSAPDLGDQPIPVSRYTSRAFHELEKARLWPRVWQMACREEELAEVGDTVVYDICTTSILLVRSAPDQVKAFYNACLHRGRRLRDHGGHTDELRCPFHGFCWTLDGRLDQVPCAWDFPRVAERPDEHRLPEVRVGTWGGFVFVNLDPECEPLDTFLGDLPEHFAKWPLERRDTQAHVAKVIGANWKAAQEAFMEAFHVVTTHPQLLPGIGDANSQYDAWEHFSRAITPNGTPSPHLAWEPSEQDMLDSMVDRRLDEPPLVEVREGQTAREAMAHVAREGLRPALGDAADELSVAELNDSIYYTVFPNFHPWGAYNRIVYRFRPNGDDHRSSIMECMLLAPFAGERPPPAPVHWLDEDASWLEAPELGMLARVFDQDAHNLPQVQRGMETMARPGLAMARYQETKIRHAHALLERWLGLAPGEDLHGAG
jgi:phenylpropionate dioxygenase-like ring-hydroxylating dioxygenase large terminal subunit